MGIKHTEFYADFKFVDVDLKNAYEKAIGAHSGFCKKKLNIKHFPRLPGPLSELQGLPLRLHLRTPMNSNGLKEMDYSRKILPSFFSKRVYGNLQIRENRSLCKF
jgi:hypothetical protein